MSYILRSILYLFIAIFITACSNEDQDTQDIPISFINDNVVRINHIDSYWDYVLFRDKSQIVCIKETNNMLSAIGVLDTDTISLNSDDKKRPVAIEITHLRLNIEYEDDRVLIYGIANNKMFTDTITLGRETYNSRATDIGVLSSITSWALDKAISASVDQVMKGIPFSDLVKFLRDLEERNTYQQLDYITDKLENWQGEVLDMFKIIPAEWWKEFLDKTSQQDKDNGNASTIIMGLNTGNAINISPTSATCLVSGVLEAHANSFELNFTYGICFSSTSLPTINDFVVDKDVIVQKNQILKISLPEKFNLVDLDPNSTYFYRSFIKDNITKEIYYSEIRSFTTSQHIPTITNLRQEASAASYDGFIFNGNKYSYKYQISLHVARDKESKFKTWGIYYNDGTMNNFIEIPTNIYDREISIELYSKFKEVKCCIGWYIEDLNGVYITGGEEILRCQCTTQPELKYRVNIKSHQEFNYTPTDVLVDTIICVYSNDDTHNFVASFKNFTINQNKSNWINHGIKLVYCESDFYRSPLIDQFDFLLSNLFLSYSLDSRSWTAKYYFNISNQTDVTYYHKSEPDLYISNGKRIEGYKNSNFKLECTVQSVK